MGLERAQALLSCKYYKRQLEHVWQNLTHTWIDHFLSNRRWVQIKTRRTFKALTGTARPWPQLFPPSFPKGKEEGTRVIGAPPQDSDGTATGKHY